MQNIGTNLMDKIIEEMNTSIGSKNLKKDLDYLSYWEAIYGQGEVEITRKGAVKVRNDEGKFVEKVNADVAKTEYAAAEAAKEMAKRLQELPAALDQVSSSLRGVKQNASEAETALKHAFGND